MEGSRRDLVLLRGGKAADAPPARPRAQGTLHVVHAEPAAELEDALAEAVEAARQMRLEIERRIARALEAFEDRG